MWADIIRPCMIKETIMRNKIRFYKILLAVLLVAMAITIIFVVRQYGGQIKAETEKDAVLTAFDKMEPLPEGETETEEEVKEAEGETLEEKDSSTSKGTKAAQTSQRSTHVPVRFRGYKVVGVIKIPKINLRYPILATTTKQSMLVSVTHFWGGDINGYGNVSIAGHNNRISKTMFGKNKYLKKGDTIYLTDLQKKTVKYEIYDIFTTDPNDVSILENTDDTVREVTLITCNKGHENRLIIKAREVNYEN